MTRTMLKCFFKHKLHVLNEQLETLGLGMVDGHAAAVLHVVGKA